ncbi:MAG TPA: MazG family protein [Nocardioidaceae bacterium]|nr:MazG family protein [Nocardioidaceae bacterium]
MRKLTLLVTTPRVAPGLMTRAAWHALEAADRVAASSDHPLARAVVASGLAVERAEDPFALDGRVVWLASDEEATTLPQRIATEIVSGDGPEVEVLHASYDVPGARLLDLVTVMDRLRRECPWDQEQTHRSLATYLLEEAYETLDAIESGDGTHLREELGDLLLQVYFHARIAAEDPEHGFTIDDVAGGIVDKLVYRHPHVFAGLEVSGAEEVNTNWETLKAAEKKRSSPLEGIPLALPALALADKVLGRMQVDPPPSDGIGERLLALVAESRRAGVDPEQALRDAVRRLTASAD